MLQRVATETDQIAGRTAAERVVPALRASLLLRQNALGDDHDPRFLHTARTVRILLADAGCTDALVLTAAAIADTVDLQLVPGAAAVGDDDACRAAAVPTPATAGEHLLEALVSADVAVALIAVAERLDHVRHLHLRAELPWRAMHEQVRSIYVPVARRAAPHIARRLERWADAFERRLLFDRPRA